MIALAEERGIPPSILRGRPTPTAGEPLWTPDDLDEVLGYRREKAKVCPGCGAHEDTWRDEAGQEINPPPLEATMSRCPGCQQLQQTQRQIPDGELGVHVHLTPAGDDGPGE